MVSVPKSRPWQCLITILDSDQNPIGTPYDFSATLQRPGNGGSITFPQYVPINGYSPWSANILLKKTLNFNLSIDQRDTIASPTGASLLAEGNAVDLRVWGGAQYVRGWPTLYILGEGEPYDPGLQDYTVLALGDITQLRNLREPERRLSSTMALGESRTRSSIANDALADLGLPTSADVITEYPLSVPPQKYNQRSSVRELGKLIGTAGYFGPWVDRDDNIRFTRIDLDKPAPDFTLTIPGDEFDRDGWVRKNLAERPPVKLIVNAAGGVATEIDNPILIEDIQAEYEYYYSFEITNNSTIEREEERQSQRRVLPEVITATTLQNSLVDAFVAAQEALPTYISHLVRPIEDTNTSIVEVTTQNTSTTVVPNWIKTTTTEYRRIGGEIESVDYRYQITRASAGGDMLRRSDIIAAESNAYSLVDAENTVITFDTRDGEFSEQVTDTRKPWGLIQWTKKPGLEEDNDATYELNRLLSFTHLRETISWERVPGNVINSLTGSTKRWQRTTRIRRYQGEDPVYTGSPLNSSTIVDFIPGSGTLTTDEDGKAAPPAMRYLPSVYTQSDDSYSGSVSITPLSGYDVHKNKEETITIQGPYGVSNAQCSLLAEIMARYRHGMNLAQQFAGEIPPWFLFSFEPGARVDVEDTDEGVTRAYMMNGGTVTFDGESTFFGCTLARLGDVGATPDVVVPPVGVSTDLTNTEQLPAVQDNAVVTAIATPVNNSETMPNVQDNPAVVPLIGINNSETMPNVQDSVSITEVVNLSNTETVPNVQDNPALSVTTSVSNNETMPNVQDSQAVVEVSGTIADIASLVGRFRADNTVNNGTTVEQLLNLVGGGADGSVQGDTNARPTINANSSNFNNRATLSTDGTNDTLRIPFGNLITGDNFTLVHVFRFTTTGALQIGPRDTLNGTGTVVHAYTADNPNYYRINSTNLGVAYNIATEAGTTAHQYLFHKNGTAAEVFQDGVSRGTVTTSTGATIGNDIEIGKNGTFNNWYALEWAETLIFNGALTGTEQTTVNNELSTYYGI